MKIDKILIFVFYLILPSSVKGQTLHSIIFSDTEDDEIGTSCQIDYRNIKNLGKNISKALQYNLNEQHYTTNFNKRNFESVFSTLRVTSNDIILFYVSTHGGRTGDDSSNFPQILVPDLMT